MSSRWPFVYLGSGFCLTVTGLAMYSLPLSLVVAGTVLFISGALSARNTSRT